MAAYTQQFYEDQSGGSARSAVAVLPHVFKICGTPTSILDVGCGVGTWLRAGKDLGVPTVVGVDGSYVDRASLKIAASEFVAHDMSTPLDLRTKFDLVMSLEVAEHLAEPFARTFVDSLVRHGDIIFFAAAIPGQGGTHHVNEQWPSYWMDLFAMHGYELFDAVRPMVWQDPSIEPWYRQNALVFASGSAASHLRDHLRRGAVAEMPVLDVVHPAVFELKALERDGARSRRVAGRLRSAAARLRGGGSVPSR